MIRMSTKQKIPGNTTRRFITLCGRVFRDSDSSYFPQAEYRGRTICFCTESCLGAFLADPAPFYQAHRNSEKDKGPIKMEEYHVE
jgi:YHS domain-containing protein